MHYIDVESFLKVRVDIPFPLEVRACLNPQQDAPPASDAEQVEELMWDAYTPVGQSAPYNLPTYQLSAKFPITIWGDRKLSTNTPSALPRHYLDPEGTPSPVLLAAAPASLAEVAFPMSHPKISAKPVEEIARRMLAAPMRFPFGGNSSAGCTNDYYEGSYAGVLWEKKVIAGTREASPAPIAEGSQVQGSQVVVRGQFEVLGGSRGFCCAGLISGSKAQGEPRALVLYNTYITVFTYFWQYTLILALSKFTTH